MLIDISSDYDPVQVIAPEIETNVSTAVVGNIVDIGVHDGVVFIINGGALTDANATFAFKLEEGNAANLSDAVDVTADTTKIQGTVPQLDFSNDNYVGLFGYKGSARYLRLTLTPTGNDSGAAPFAVMALLKRKKVGGPSASLLA